MSFVARFSPADSPVSASDRREFAFIERTGFAGNPRTPYPGMACLVEQSTEIRVNRAYDRNLARDCAILGAQLGDWVIQIS